MTVYDMDELVKLSINNLVAAVPKHAKVACVCEVKPHVDWVTQLVYVPTTFPQYVFVTL